MGNVYGYAHIIPVPHVSKASCRSFWRSALAIETTRLCARGSCIYNNVLVVVSRATVTKNDYLFGTCTGYHGCTTNCKMKILAIALLITLRASAVQYDPLDSTYYIISTLLIETLPVMVAYNHQVSVSLVYLSF